jgi:hypothetical protein
MVTVSYIETHIHTAVVTNLGSLDSLVSVKVVLGFHKLLSVFGKTPKEIVLLIPLYNNLIF